MEVLIQDFQHVEERSASKHGVGICSNGCAAAIQLLARLRKSKLAINDKVVTELEKARL